MFMRKLKLLFAVLALIVGGSISVNAYTTDNLESAGWTKVTESAITGIADNYYMLVDANSSAYVMSNDATHFRPCYKTLADPVANPSFVWILEGSNNEFNLKSYSTGAYFKQAAGWNTSVGYARDSRTKVTGVFELNEGKYTLKCKESSSYIGHWNDDGAAVKEDGENIAANKAIGNAPGFYLYSIPKTTFDAALAASRFTPVSTATKASPADVTSYIQNADWSNDWGGWESTFTSSGNMQWGQQTLESWNASNVIVKQELNGVPNGKYKLTADVISGPGAAKAAYVYATGDSKVSSDAVSAEASENNYTTMSNEVAGKTLTADNVNVTGNAITVGIDQSEGWIVADNFKLYYYGPNLASSAALPAGNMAVGTWYYFDVVIDGTYNIACTTLSDIVYTTDGSILVEDAASVTNNFAGTAVALTAGRYYVKSASAQTLSVTPASYSYIVGSATPSITSGSYVQKLTTVSFDFTEATTNDPEATFAILNGSAVATLKKGGSSVNTGTLALEGTTLMVTFTDVTLDATSAYSVEIPAGVVGYAGEAQNTAITVSFNTPMVFDGTYYLYDATNKLFLSRGKNIGARAVVDQYGLPFSFTTNENNASLIEFRDWPGKYVFFDKDDHADCWIYTDGDASRGDNRLVALETTSGGYYLRDAAKAVYILHDNSVLSVPTTDVGKATVWTLMSKAERDAIVNAYPTTNKSNVIAAASLSTTAAEFETFLSNNYAAKDMTSKVGTAKFTKAGGKGDWTWTKETGNDATYGDDWTEGYQNAGTWSQTISGLTPGIYKVTVNGFERKAGYALCNTLGAEGYEPVTAYFKANDEQLPLKSWFSEKTGTNNPDNTGQAATAFNNDKYKNTLYTYVADGGEGTGSLTLTIGKQDKADGSWVLFNNVTLTYYDSSISDAESYAILTEAADELDKPMKPSLYQALVAAKNTFDGAKTVPNYNALRTAIDNTATSVASYAAMNKNYLEPVAALLASSNIIDKTSSAYTDYVAYKAKYDNYMNAETADIENATANALTLWQGTGNRYTGIGNILMATGWMINGKDALTDGSGFYANTWSTENDGTAPAKDFTRPFYEMWVSSGNIPAATLTRTVDGLTANGIYKVSANVRVQGNEKVAGSITMQAGSGTTVDVTAGSKIGSTSRYIDAYTSFGQADADGKLTITFTVAADSKVSWLAFRDVNIEESASSESVTVTADGYATYVSSLPLDYTSTEIKAYTAKVDAGKVVLTPINKVPAATPVVLYKEGGATEDIPVATTTDTPAASDLVAGTGAAVATDGGTGYTNYILNNVSGIGFYLAAGQTVAKNRAYLHVATGGGAPALAIVFDNEATGINNLKVAANGDAIYNLNGQRVEKAQKGLYIIGGKKVVIK